jgi:tetratricopeptide (TPR) repeat protein
MKEHLDPRFVFYYAKTLFHLKKTEEAIKAFQDRIFLGGCPFEMYLSYLHLAMLEKDPLSQFQKYQSISQSFPNEAEPLFYMSICLHELKRYKESIFCLEKALICPMTHLSKYIINQVYLPRLIAKYYYTLNKQVCLSLLFEQYTQPKRPFDFIMESYLRNILNIHISTDPISVVTFHPNGSHDSTFSEHTLTEYQECVTSYPIRNLVVWNATDRIPYFPNIYRIHYVIEKELPKGTMLESFPQLVSIVYPNESIRLEIEESFPYLRSLLQPKLKEIF